MRSTSTRTARQPRRRNFQETLSLRGALAPKQSRLSPRIESGLLRFARNDVVSSRQTSLAPRRVAPGVCIGLAPSRQRAQGMPGAGRNPWPACSKKSRRQLPQVQPIIRHSLRNGFNAYSALSPGTGLSCSRHLAFSYTRSLASASGGQDHTPSPSAPVMLVSHRHRVHRIPPQRP